MISLSIQTNLLTLQAQVVDATPLEDATTSVVKAIQLNTTDLVEEVQAALIAPGTLDNWSAPSDAPSMIEGFNDIVTQATDESNLALLRGVLGRVLANVGQLA
jgi:hypothetical protein